MLSSFRQVNRLFRPRVWTEKLNRQYEKSDTRWLDEGGRPLDAAFLSHPIFNRSFAVVMIFISMPIMVVTAIIIKINNRKEPVLYKHTRLGACKQPFTMLKFRTLPSNSDKVIGSRIFDSGIVEISAFNRFLRDTRIDEIPQLFNILRGNMNFIGPRPERPEVYEAYCKTIKNFDLRFKVKPGLIGFSQVLTPHKAPRRIRSYIDNRRIAHKRTSINDAGMLALSAYLVFKRLLIQVNGYLWKKIARTLWAKHYKEMRAIEREKITSAKLYFESNNNGNGQRHLDGLLYDMNDQYFKLYTNKKIRQKAHNFMMRRTIRKKSGQKGKIARCCGIIEVKRRSEKKSYKYCYIFSYEALSPLNKYMFDKYFLNKSIG